MFKFGKWIDHGKSHCRGEKFSVKGASSGSRDSFRNFKPPSIFLEWMKLRFLNMASGSTTVSPTQETGRSKKFPPKEARSGSRDRFGGEAMLFKFRKCIDYSNCVEKLGLVRSSTRQLVLPWSHATHHCIRQPGRHGQVTIASLPATRTLYGAEIDSGITCLSLDQQPGRPTDLSAERFTAVNVYRRVGENVPL